jgi:hypothetical protein
LILLLFAFICGIIWWLTETTFKDEVSKNILIPGFKIALILFAFILVLVDVYMFVETNRFVTAGGNNVSNCLSYNGTMSYYPAIQSVVGGTLLSGTVNSLFYVDNDIDNILENNAGQTELYANYTGVTAFNKFDFAGTITGNATPFYIEAYQNITGWDTLYTFSYPGNFNTGISLNGSKYTDANGTVQLRIISATAGSISDHLQVDWLILEGSQTYTAYCNSGDDTRNVFIFHQMESGIMLLLLTLLPYGAILLMAIIVIQVILLLANALQGKKPGGQQ